MTVTLAMYDDAKPATGSVMYTRVYTTTRFRHLVAMLHCSLNAATACKQRCKHTTVCLHSADLLFDQTWLSDRHRLLSMAILSLSCKFAHCARITCGQINSHRDDQLRPHPHVRHGESGNADVAFLWHALACPKVHFSWLHMIGHQLTAWP